MRIENDVWLGTNSTIMSGITIGNGAVVAAFSVVTKNVPPYAIVGGNPACIIRHRFAEEVVKRLLEIKWWDWPETYVRSLIPDMLSNDIEGFLSTAHRMLQAEGSQLVAVEELTNNRPFPLEIVLLLNLPIALRDLAVPFYLFVNFSQVVLSVHRRKVFACALPC